MSKSTATDLISFLVVIIGYATQNDTILMTGLFALSGAITNHLAIYMLFEKVPFLYGSGVIEEKFEDFKLGIHGLVMNQFFTKENLEKFFSSNDSKDINLEPVINSTDMTPAFESLKTAVMESPFGGMLSMFGGASALDSLKQPFEEKLKSSLIKITSSQSFKDTLKQNINSGNFTHDILAKIDHIIKARLEELTPKMVKEIIENMIKHHLGWLVIWGGIFGGLIGLVSSFIV